MGTNVISAAKARAEFRITAIRARAVRSNALEEGG
jgi:hypothetical protein